MAVLSKVAKPFTPLMRRFLMDVFKPAPAVSDAVTLGKRHRRDEDHVEGLHQHYQQDVVVGLSNQSNRGTEHLPNCVALQNDDADDEDAVIITALNVIPFCCHADLLTMSREALVRVAETLNEKLPLSMRIDTSTSRSDAFIRNSIELLVGIRKTVPPAPKANRRMSLEGSSGPKPKILGNGDDEDEEDMVVEVPSSPVSPLANRSNRAANLSFVASPPLTALNEEDEEEAEDENMSSYSPIGGDRPLRKKRKLVMESPVKAYEDETPSPSSSPIVKALLSRSHSQRTPRSDNNSPFSFPLQRGAVMRSQSQRVPPRKRVQALTSPPSRKASTSTAASSKATASTNVHRNITITRGRGRGYSGSGSLNRNSMTRTSAVLPIIPNMTTMGNMLTSTPKNKKRKRSTNVSSTSGSDMANGSSTGSDSTTTQPMPMFDLSPAKFKLLPLANPETNLTAATPPSVSTQLKGTPDEISAVTQFGMKRKGDALDKEMYDVEDADDTFGLEGMSMADEANGSASDMDISLE